MKMPSAVTLRNWLYFMLAYLVCLITVAANPELSPRHPTYLLLARALGMTLPCAIPAFAAQVWGKKSSSRAYHGWTLIVALFIASGSFYAYTHPMH